ncbi:5-oxoprolinase subunit B family protein [Actinomycetes bacterium M1A6_2h]
MNILPMGDRALLVETDSVESHFAGWSASLLPGVVELVPAAATVLVRFEGVSAAAVADWLRSTDPAPVSSYTGSVVDIDVRYDGPDLDFVASATGLDVVAAHTGQVWTVAFCGFSPGFAYLVGDGSLTVPRLESPRTSVPAGSVGLAGEYSGVYPSASPGGWQLIGTTDAVLWDVRRDPPALLAPGTRVQFRSVT